MAHGAPDFQNVGVMATVFGVYDLGELGVRLGSIDTYDRRGNVIWLDGVEDGLAPYYTASDGTGASVAQSNAASRNGGYSIALTAGSDGSHSARARRYHGQAIAGKMGFESSFALSAAVGDYTITINLYDGTRLTSYGLKYDPALAKLYILQLVMGLAVWTEVGDLDLFNHQHLFHTLKLVVDTDADAYIRLMLDALTFDLSAYTPYSVANASNPYVNWDHLYTGRLGQNDVLYLDDFILTQNEP